GYGDVVFDEDSLPNLADRDRAKGLARFLAHAIVARSADGEVAFLERVGQGKDLSKRAAVHVGDYRPSILRRWLQARHQLHESGDQGLTAARGAIRSKTSACWTTLDNGWPGSSTFAHEAEGETCQRSFVGTPDATCQPERIIQRRAANRCRPTMIR